MQDRYKQLLEAIEEERKSEEQYYANLAKQKTTKERVSAGVLLTHLTLEKRYYTVGEYVELKLHRTKDVSAPHKFKVGVGCQVIIEGERTKSYRGTVSYRKKEQLGVIIAGDSVSPGDFPESISYKLELVYDERPYQVMRSAIQQVMESKEQSVVELREGIRLQAPLYGVLDDNPARWSIPQHLNESQTIAIKEILTADKMGIIHGPPGTGKTTTLVALIQTLLQKERRILVCGPSNNSVDLLASKASELGLKVIRLGNVTRIDDDVAHLTLDEQARMHPDWGHIKKVKIEAEEARKIASQRKRKFGYTERQNRGAMYKESRELKKWARDLEEKLVESIIEQAQVICTTLIGVSNKALEGLKFSTVIIDEASQAVEPECWNAMLKAHRVIFAGDHMQLSPTVKSQAAVDLGLSTTLLDRMTPFLKHKHLLTTQYRMNEQILQFSNNRFYNGNLKSAPNVANHQLTGGGPVITLIDTSGCGFDEQLNPKTRSTSNEGEYFIVREQLLAEMDRLQGVSIGIISPYAEQIRYISQEVSEDEVLRAMDITVNTIDGFQGQERDVILISLVRSNDAGVIGFVADERRLNVAMTRAKKRLIIVGDIATLGNHQLFLDLVDHFEKTGNYKSAWEFMS